MRTSNKVLWACLLVSLGAEAGPRKKGCPQISQIESEESVQIISPLRDHDQITDQSKSSVQEISSEVDQNLTLPPIKLAPIIKATFGQNRSLDKVSMKLQDLLSLASVLQAPKVQEAQRRVQESYDYCMNLINNDVMVKVNSSISEKALHCKGGLGSQWDWNAEDDEVLMELEDIDCEDIAQDFTIHKIQNISHKIMGNLSQAKEKLDHFVGQIKLDYQPQSWPVLDYLETLQETIGKVDQVRYDLAAAALLLDSVPMVPTAENKLEAYENMISKVATHFNKEYDDKADLYLNQLVDFFEDTVDHLKDALEGYKQGQGSWIPGVFQHLSCLFREENGQLRRAYDLLANKDSLFLTLQKGLRNLEEGLYLLGKFLNIGDLESLLQQFPVISPEVKAALYPVKVRRSARIATSSPGSQGRVEKKAAQKRIKYLEEQDFQSNQHDSQEGEESQSQEEEKLSSEG